MGLCICFNFSVEVTLPVCAGPDLLHDKCFWGLGLYVQEKGQVLIGKG